VYIAHKSTLRIRRRAKTRPFSFLFFYLILGIVTSCNFACTLRVTFSSTFDNLFIVAFNLVSNVLFLFRPRNCYKLSLCVAHLTIYGNLEEHMSSGV